MKSLRYIAQDVSLLLSSKITELRKTRKRKTAIIYFASHPKRIIYFRTESMCGCKAKKIFLETKKRRLYFETHSRMKENKTFRKCDCFSASCCGEQKDFRIDVDVLKPDSFFFGPQNDDRRT
jgi:hypothetical protein